VLFYRHVRQISLLPMMRQPLLAASAMAGWLWLTGPLHWMARGASAVLVYFLVLLLLGEPEVRSWAARARQVAKV
jgi:hypothetical protein